MSNRLTFSLASLTLIFALAFASMPAMAADGGPTVTIADVGTTAAPSTRTAFLLKFTFSHSVTDFDDAGDATFQLYDKDDTLIGATPTPITPAAVADKPREYTASIDVSSTTGDPVGFRVTVPTDSATGNKLTNSLGNQMKFMDFDLPPLVSVGSLTLGITKAATQDTTTDGTDYVLTLTYTDADEAAAAPDPEPAVAHLTFDPSYLETAVLNGNTVVENTDTADAGDYTLNIVHPTGAPPVTIGVQPSYIEEVEAKMVPPPAAVVPAPPMVAIDLGDPDESAREFRISVTITPQPKSDGSAGAEVTTMNGSDEDGFINHITAKDSADGDVILTESAGRGGDNMYTGILKYDRLSMLPITLSIDPNDLVSGSKPDVDPVTAMVGEAAPEDMDAPPTAEIAVSGVDVSMRTFTVEVALTPGTKADGSPGDAITDFGKDDLEIMGQNDSMPRITVVDESLGNNSYLAELQWNPLSTRNLPFTVKAILSGSGDDTVYYMDTSDPTMAATDSVSRDGTTDPVDPPVDSTNTDPVVTISTTAPTAPVADGSFAVVYTATDSDGTVASVRSDIDVTSSAAGYWVSGGTNNPGDNSVTITQPSPTAEMMTIPAATVTVTITATDDDGAMAEASLEVDFAERMYEAPNTAPVITITSEEPIDAVSTGTFSIAYTITDPDTDDTVTVSADVTAVSPSSAMAHYTVGTPADGMVTITQAAPTATMMTIPGAAVTVTLTATDGTASAAPAMLTVSFDAMNYVAPNMPPTFNANLPATINAKEGVAITPVTFGATDSDGGTLAYSWDVDETALGLMLSATTGTVSGTPNKAHSGSHPITVMDGQGGSATHPLMVTVVGNNDPVFTVDSFDFPALTAGTAHPVTLPGATDEDMDTLAYSIRGTLPAGLMASTNASQPLRISGTPTAQGTVSVIYVVSDGRGGEDTLPLTITVNSADPAVTNRQPTFNGQIIQPITVTVGTPIIRDLPEATDPDGDLISYSIRPPRPAGLDFNSRTRRLSGTPTAAQALTNYIYVASDGKGGTAQLTLTITVRARTVVPPSGDLPATHANGVTTISSGTIAGNDFAVVGSGSLPDLEAFLFVGGTIGLGDGDGDADNNSRTVVISEILWGLDLGAAVDMETQHQFIELYNTTDKEIDVSGWMLTFTEGRSVPASDIDQVSNRSGQGWVADIGQSGRVSGTSAVDVDNTVTPIRIVSMYRNINYTHVEKNTGNRGELVKGIPGGNAKGSWKASTRHTDNRWIYDSRGRKHATSTVIITASSVARSPFIINEIGNGADNSDDWIELRNVTGDTHSLKNYHLSMVTATGTDTSLVNFKDKDYKVEGNGYIVIANTDPSDTDLAGGVDVSKAAADQDKKGAQHLYYVDANLKLPNDGNFNLILRNAHDKLKASSHFIDVVGMQRYNDNSRGTSLWPLSGTGAPGGNVNENGDENFKSGIVYIRKDAGGGTGDKDWGQQGYTGVGYDRTALNSAANGGTPGYENGAVKEKVADVSDGDISISEIMIDTGSSRFNLPQWIEIYNSSMTRAVNLNAWKLQIENAADPNVSTFNTTLTLDAMTVAPNQTVLIVSTSGRTSDSDHFPSTRVVNLWTTKKHREALEMVNRNDMVLSPMGFHLTLIDKDNKTVDMVGNLDGNRRTRDTATWDIPMNEADDRRSSLIRRDDDGEIEESWVLASETGFSWSIAETYYGAPDDVGSPGFRGGGPLPVRLSKFRPERLEDGSIVVRWVTESELDNAGFNILRSETLDGEYTKLNEQLIAGNGTTSERNTYDFADTSAKPNVVYYYQIQDVSLDGDVQTLRVSRLKGHISAAGKLTTTWGELKSLQ